MEIFLLIWEAAEEIDRGPNCPRDPCGSPRQLKAFPDSSESVLSQGGSHGLHPLYFKNSVFKIVFIKGKENPLESWPGPVRVSVRVR